MGMMNEKQFSKIVFHVSKKYKAKSIKFLEFILGGICYGSYVL